MSYPPNQKPPQWSIDPGVVAYNALRMGLPMPGSLWAMWEKGGSKVYDLTGKGYNGTITNATWSEDKLNFDGTGDYVDIPNITLTTNYTISFLAKLTDSGDNPNMLMGDNTGTAYYAYCRHNTRFRYRGAITSCDFTDDKDFYDRLREYTIVVNSGGYPTLYLDGVFQGLSGIIPGTVKFYTIGKGYFNDSYDWQGSIHRAVWFPAALTAAQVAALSADPYGLITDPYGIEILGFVAAGGISIPVVQHHRRRH